MARIQRGCGLPANRRDAAGNMVCCWCGGQLGPRRQRWCGQACIDDYAAQASQAGARNAVLRRDRGVCALCGFDAVRIERFIERLRCAANRVVVDVAQGPVQRGVWFEGGSGWGITHLHPAQARRAEQYEIAVALLMLWGARNPTGTLWEADHVVPLIEGGSLRLDNLRTLCLPCHRRETRGLARRRALARKSQQRLPGLGVR